MKSAVHRLFHGNRTNLVAIIPFLAVLAGCSMAEIQETYRRGVPDAPPSLSKSSTGAAAPAADTRLVTRTIKATRVMSVAGTSPGESITHLKPLKVADGGVEFGGMESVEEAARGPMLLIGAGILCILAGGAVFLFIGGAKQVGLGVIGLGAVFVVSGLAFEAYPWAALVLIGLAAAGAAVWFIYSTRSGERLRQTLQFVAAGIEQTPENQAVKENISNAAATRSNREMVKDVVAGAKKSL